MQMLWKNKTFFTYALVQISLYKYSLNNFLIYRQKKTAGTVQYVVAFFFYCMYFNSRKHYIH